jgi:hypothetical protein
MAMSSSLFHLANVSFCHHLLSVLPTKFQFIWPCGFRGEYFFKSANQKQELTVAAMFVNESERN